MNEKQKIEMVIVEMFDLTTQAREVSKLFIMSIMEIIKKNTSVIPTNDAIESIRLLEDYGLEIDEINNRYKSLAQWIKEQSK
tara:strand:- start:503 stop:748 length:246 start_codon:yes stop_codon:yes gene_type:complete